MAPMTLPWYPAGSLRFKKSESDSASVELKRLIGLRILVGIQKFQNVVVHKSFFLHLHLHLQSMLNITVRIGHCTRHGA